MSWSRHLTTGLRLLGERWFAGPRRWIAEADGAVDWTIRVAMVGAGGYLLWRVLSASWRMLAATVLVVIVLALRAATEAAKAPPEKPPAGPPEGRRELFAGELQDAIWDVLDGAPAVHLTTLADHLSTLTGDTWTAHQVRAACTAHGIPVRPKVRDLGGDRVSSGVHRDDLEPLPQPLPEGAQKGGVDDYAAGQGGNAERQRYAPTRTVRRVGDLRVTTVDDPDNPARTRVTVTDPRRRKRA